MGRTSSNAANDSAELAPAEVAGATASRDSVSVSELRPADAAAVSAASPRAAVSQLANQLMELFLPSACRLCDQPVANDVKFCRRCESDLRESEALMRSACLRCGRPGAAASQTSQSVTGTRPVTRTGSVEPEATQLNCPECRNQRLAFDRCVALWTYSGLVRRAVVSAKYGSQIALADALGERLADRLIATHLHWAEFQREPTISRPMNSLPDFVTPVPSHVLRRVQRGGGGTRILADAVARRMNRWGYSVQSKGLLRAVRRIRKQAWLSEKQRIGNVRGAFRLTRRMRSRKDVVHSLVGRHVLVVDDVMTTGATASEIARVLKAAGVSRVTIAVVARACGS